MDRAEECLCCREIGPVMNKISDAGNVANHRSPLCITNHPGFDGVCLNQWVLETAWYNYRQQYDEGFDGPEHKEIGMLHIDNWLCGVGGKLGRHIRVVLPSFAVSCVRAHFPPPGPEEDHQFIDDLPFDN